MSTSVYDIPLASWDGADQNVLEKYRGKVCLIINVTTDCGNAPQYGIIEEIYQKYKDRGFEVVAIPTNDFCGPGITYGKWEAGIGSAAEAKSYAEDVYDVTYDFAELVTSKPGLPWSNKLKPEQSTHPLYEHLVSETTGDGMYGNFEKFLINREGQVVANFSNYTLLDYAYTNMVNNVPPLGGKPHGITPMTSTEAYDAICEAIEAAL
jgi:glutathione peroxidase